MRAKRSGAGLSKPNCFSSSLMKAGSSPCDPRYLDEKSPPPAAVLPPPPPKFEVAPESVPCSCERTRSTGPPGANCTMTKEMKRIPTIVGTIKATRRRI